MRRPPRLVSHYRIQAAEASRSLPSRAVSRSAWRERHRHRSGRRHRQHQLQANPAGLSAGYYFTALTIVSSAGTITVPVTLFIAARPEPGAGPLGGPAGMPAGGVAANPDTSFLVNVSGASASSAVAFTAAVLPGAPWLNLATTSGTATSNTPGTVNYSINQTAAAALSPQAYYGTIRVTSPGTLNSPVDFQVVLNVTAANAPQAPAPTPAGMIFISSGEHPAAPDRSGICQFGYASRLTRRRRSTASGGSWLAVSPATGTTSAASPAQTSVSVNPAGLAAGVYRGSVSYSLAAAAVPTVNVTLLVKVRGRFESKNGPVGSGRHDACTPTQIIATQTGLVNDFTAPASWPTPLQIQLSDDCGSAVTNGQIVATFSNGDPPLALGVENAASGLYAGTWTPRDVRIAGGVTATATAPGFPRPRRGFRRGGAECGADAFCERDAGCVCDCGRAGRFHSARNHCGRSMGRDWRDRPRGGTLPLKTSLDGTAVIIGGIAAPLYFVSPGQLTRRCRSS